MARSLRIEFPGAVYHVMSRGNIRQPVYLEAGDHTNFLNLLLQVAQKYNWLCHAYCLMPNHYHLLIETVDGRLSSGMRHLNGVYTQRFNRRHQRCGHLFQGRFKSVLVEKEAYLLELARYIVLNPVRAGLVKHPSEWKWSSYPDTMRANKQSPLLSRKWILSQFSDKHDEACRQYRDFVDSALSNASSKIQTGPHHCLGDVEFKRNLHELLKERQNEMEIPKKQRFDGRPSLDDIFGTVSLLSKEQRSRKIFSAVYRYAYSQKDVAVHLGCHYSTVSKVLKKLLIAKNSRIKT